MEFFLPIAIILGGLALVAIEVYFVPGFNVIGISGLLAVVFGLGYMFAEQGLTGGIVAVVVTIAVGGVLFYTAWQSGVWDRFVLGASLRADEEVTAREAEARSRYLGKVGRAVTPLRPTGVVEIDGERIEVATEGDYVAAGSEVRVVAMDRRRFFVRLATLATEKPS